MVLPQGDLDWGGIGDLFEGLLAPRKPGREFPGVGTGAIIWSEDHLLMVLRAGSHGAGTWSVPGGWLEMGEDPCDGAVREVKEETGLDVIADRQLGYTNIIHKDEKLQAVTLWVEMRPLVGQPKCEIVEPDKCPEIEWVHKDYVHRLPLFGALQEYWPVIKRGQEWWHG